MTFSYQLIKAMTKSEKETRQQLYVFVEEKKLGETRDNSARIHLHTGMTCHCPVTSMTLTLRYWCSTRAGDNQSCSINSLVLTYREISASRDLVDWTFILCVCWNPIRRTKTAQSNYCSLTTGNALRASFGQLRFEAVPRTEKSTCWPVSQHIPHRITRETWCNFVYYR